ncbi:MAG: flavoprotein [Gemmataceae bacterium]
MGKVLLGVTGSVAAIKTPDLFRALTRAGHQVKIVATGPATYFFRPETILPLDKQGSGRPRDLVFLDEDEWPGRIEYQQYQRQDPVLHIELRRWADLFLVAPLDANTLGKLALGLCDNCLTCVWRAWEPSRPVVLAPAMNTLMWQHPATLRHLRQLAQDAGAQPSTDLTLDDLVPWMNTHCPRLRVAAPETRELACGDTGPGAMAALPTLVQLVAELI